jgi:hypothetical protein
MWRQEARSFPLIEDKEIPAADRSLPCSISPVYPGPWFCSPMLRQTRRTLVLGIASLGASRAYCCVVMLDNYGPTVGSLPTFSKQHAHCSEFPAKLRHQMICFGFLTWESEISIRWDVHRQPEEPNLLTGKIPPSAPAVWLLIQHSSVALRG